jgi:membrane protease YdiL (CAAX protease family)
MNNRYKRYLLFTYLTFWVFIGITGLVLMKVSDNSWLKAFMVMLCSWTPTFVLLIMFRKLMPEKSRKDFFRGLFHAKINCRLLLSITGIQLAVFFIAVALVSRQQNVPFISLINTSVTSCLTAFFINLMQGATGEEAGWRGYLQPIMEEKYGLIKGCIMVGFIQGFWHLPLWFTTGYTGWTLALYIGCFLVSIVSFSVLAGLLYHMNRNAVLPILLHFMFNMTVSSIFVGNIMDLLPIVTVGYLIIAVAVGTWYLLKEKS